MSKLTNKKQPSVKQNPYVKIEIETGDLGSQLKLVPISLAVVLRKDLKESTLSILL